jgi:hypothetical protein
MLNSRTLFAALLMVCLLTPCASAKGNLNDWNNVRILNPGDTIVIKTRIGEKYEGRFDHATADKLFVVVDIPHVMKRIIELQKDEVKEVRKKIPQTTSLAICTGIGFGAGLAIGAAVDAQDKFGEDPGLGKRAFSLLGLTLGLAVGTGVHFNGKRVYEAP